MEDGFYGKKGEIRLLCDVATFESQVCNRDIFS